MQNRDASDTNQAAPVGWLLLRDGHAVPIFGLEPDEIKAACKLTVPGPAGSLPYRRRLDAIVHCLGFRGDFGDYARRHWPALLAFLRKHGCNAWRNLFSASDADVAPFYFGPTFGPQRRQLADRVFFGGRRAPSRVFLGVDVDWREWDRRADSAYARTRPLAFPDGAARAAVAPPADVLIANRHALLGQWGFLDDKLVAGELGEIVDKTYRASPQTPAESTARADEIAAVLRAFRGTFPEDGPGWVDVLRLEDNDRLVILRAQDGSWDVLWHDLRESAPPPANKVPERYALQAEDLPELLAGEQSLARKLYFRRDVWDEREAHVAEQHYYDAGHTVTQRQLATSDEVRRTWLASTGSWPVRRQVSATDGPPMGFRRVTVGSRTLLVSELITVGEYRQMLDESGYLERRASGGEDWQRANDPELVSATAPVGATWYDAQAYCAWKERSLGRQLRLPTLAELRAMRPFHGPHYRFLSEHDFPWENYPPRPLAGDGPSHEGGAAVPVRSAVIWSEPRFLDPDPENGIAELPPPGGWGGGRGRKRCITDFPPRAAWRDDAWAEHSGLRFIDAWDAYEWAQEQGMSSGRFWEGPIGADTWGAYKNSKIGFRIVIATP